MKRVLFIFVIIFAVSDFASQQLEAAQLSAVGNALSIDSIKSAINVFWKKTSCSGPISKRFEAMNILQRAADSCSNIDFKTYLKSDNPQFCTQTEQNGIYYYYKAAFDKVKKEIEKTKVKRGTVAVWLLYNMGYVVKTPTSCFGIDICHKYGHLLANDIDFLLITHNHGDHYTAALIAAMENAGKPVVSNFIGNKYKVAGKSELKFGDIDIHTSLCDHNATLVNFVVSYEIDCGPATNNYKIFHVGDACNFEQIEPIGNVDLFIPHLSVGLDIPKAVQIIQPRIVLLSHVLEMNHAVDKWRWSYQFGVDKCRSIKQPNVFLPVWGEKILLKK